MPKKKQEAQVRGEELLEKLVVFQLYALGASRDRIARAVGRQKAWVTNLLRGLPRGGQSDGEKRQGKKAKGRSGR